MKTIIYISILFLTLLLSPSTLISQWQWQNPYPQGNNLDDIFFINQNTGWICGQAGTVLKTTNKGIDWNYYPVKIPDAIMGIQFINEYTGFAASWDWGTTGSIYKSTNGGINFSLIKQINNNGCSDVYFYDDNNGWIAGTHGLIFRTTDCGNNWSEQQTASATDITRLCFLNLDTGFASSFDGYILKTTNSGLNWSKLYHDSGKIFYSVNFIDINTGFITGYSGLLYKTTNSGMSWINLSSLSQFGNYVQDIKFINSNTGWLATGRSNSSNDIFKTTNCGINWTNQNIYLRNSETLNRLWISDSSNIYCVGDGGSILKTSNSGLNWNYQTKGFYNWLNNIYFIDEFTGWTIGTIGNSTVYKTTTGGALWDSISSYPPVTYDLIFFNSLNGISLCKSGQIKKTTDGGFHWINIESGTSEDLLNMSFINSNTGWACGGYSPILKTINGGLNWFQVSNNPGCYLTSICFTDENSGWLAGNNCSDMYYSTNGGQNWISKSTPVNTYYREICFPNSNTGYMCGYGGIIAKTINAGQNWVLQNTGVQINLQAIQFLNPYTGYASGDYSTILKTTNGGESWSKFNIDVSWFYIFFSLKFINENTGWVSGVNGNILKTTNGGTTYTSNNEVIIPKDFILKQNYPNPFNPMTKICYELPKQEFVTIKVYDISGKEIRTIVNEIKQAGIHYVDFYAFLLPSGVYFYKMSTEDYTQAKRMILLK